MLKHTCNETHCDHDLCALIIQECIITSSGSALAAKHGRFHKYIIIKVFELNSIQLDAGFHCKVHVAIKAQCQFSHQTW